MLRPAVPSESSVTHRVALVAHASKKTELLEWARTRRKQLARQELLATATTGKLLEHELGLAVEKLQSGPLGGDQQLGARIVDGAVDLLIFFWDPLSAHPHDADVRALLRIAVLYDIPTACNPATADLVFSSLPAGAQRSRSL
jgi:methylglyoxal synthase